MAALDAAPPPANMLRRFFNSCFNKRPESTPPHLQGSTETDSSDATLVPPHSPPHSSGLTIRDRMRTTGKGKAVSEAQSPAANTPTMPKAAKEKKAAKSTKDRKPYSKAARYYNDNQNHGGSNKADAAARAQLNKFFDDLIPEEEKARSSEPISEIGAEQSMAYLERLEVNMASYELFVVLEIVKAESIGTITRSGFVDGWARIMAETSHHANSNMRVTPDWAGQQQYVRGRIAHVMVDDDYFKTLYDFAFQVGREPPQKAVGMAVAVSFWEGLYEPSTNPWRSAHVNWLEQWTAYLREKYGVVKVNEDGEEEVEYKRTVSKDLWTQTRLFAIKTMKDETLGFWSEEQAWPGIIDDFVLWCREKGIVKEKKPEDAMEAE